jgi:3-deoxy-D-manno-octulosonic-acid transferase
MWDWAIWAALVLGTLAGIAALAMLVVRSLEAWRAFQQTRGAVVGGLDEFAAQAEAVADKLAAAGGTAELQKSVGRLRVSLARLDVLRAALDEVDGTVGRVTAYLPHK